jgi:exosortase A
MSTPVLTDTAAPTAIGTAEWRRVAIPLAAGLLLLGALFLPEITAAIGTWDASTAYNHCYLVIPIVLYLLWDRRFDRTGIPARPMPYALLLAIPVAAVWLVAERLGIMEGRQLAVMSFVEILFLAILGKRLWWAVAGPLLYLYFLVPFGDFLTTRLQDFTVLFIRHGLEILGIPAYIDGYIIEIPQGTFFVAEACAGLRFLIASIAFGTLYALMMYRSPVRRAAFIAVSVVVPIVANGFRGLGIVYLGYLLNSAEAAAADHIIYGWIFFSIVILILIALGLPFRQDDITTRSSAPPGPVGRPPTMMRLAIITAALLIIAAISPATAEALRLATLTPAHTPALLDVGPGCIVTETAADLPGVRAQRVTCGDTRMDMTWAAFSPHITAAPLMAERRRMSRRVQTEGLSEKYLADTRPSAWLIMRSNEPAYEIAVSVWIDGHPVRPGLGMRMRMAISSLFGSKYAPMVVTVTPVVDWDNLAPEDRKAAEASVPNFLLSHPTLDRNVGAVSALR